MLQSEFDLLVEDLIISDSSQYIEVVKEKKPIIIIDGLAIDGIDVQINQSIIDSIKTPIIKLTFKDTQKNPEEPKYDPLFNNIQLEGDNLHTIAHSVKRMLRISQSQNSNAKYIPISLDLLMVHTELLCDTYVKLEEEKFVLLYEKGHTFTNEEYSTATSKYEGHLHTKKIDYKMLSDWFYKKMEQYLQKQSSQIKSLKFISKNAVKVGYDLYKNFGLRQNVLDSANLYLDSTLNILTQRPELIDILNNFISKNNYLSQHSLLVAVISCSIAKKYLDASEFSTEALVLASYFHDITLENDELEIEYSTKSNLGEKLIDEKYLSFVNHPKKACQLIDGIEGVSPLVKQLIMEHHERPDAKGFPNKVDESGISKLSSVFIVSHAFVNCLFLIKTTNADKEAIFEQFKNEYNIGSFKTAYEGIISCCQDELKS